MLPATFKLCAAISYRHLRNMTGEGMGGCPGGCCIWVPGCCVLFPRTPFCCVSGADGGGLGAVSSVAAPLLFGSAAGALSPLQASCSGAPGGAAVADVPLAVRISCSCSISYSFSWAPARAVSSLGTAWARSRARAAPVLQWHEGSKRWQGAKGVAQGVLSAVCLKERSTAWQTPRTAQ